jgi:fructose-1,6-bisphosphatase I
MISLRQFLSQHPLPDGLEAVLLGLVKSSKRIQRDVSMAGLRDVCGAAGQVNVQGEDVQKLDLLANNYVKDALNECGQVAVMASEEEDDHVIPDNNRDDGYAVLFDPLDGSSNIDVNVSVGTIFSIYKTVPELSPKDNCLQKGDQQVLAGYVLYGTSTMLVFTSGQGTHGFTYDAQEKQYFLSHENLSTPDKETYYSINEGNASSLFKGTLAFIDYLKGLTAEGKRSFSARYVGSLVSDFHRNLLKGGIYIYPGTQHNPQGKLRLLYEANPLAFICEQAGGRCSDGVIRTMEIVPNTLHQRCPLYIGNEKLVLIAEKYESKTTV